MRLGTRTRLATPGAPGSGPHSLGEVSRSPPGLAAPAPLLLPTPRVRYLLGAGGCSMAAGGRRRYQVAGEGRSGQRAGAPAGRARGTTEGNSRNSNQLPRNSAADPPPAGECGASRPAPPLGRRPPAAGGEGWAEPCAGEGDWWAEPRAEGGAGPSAGEKRSWDWKGERVRPSQDPEPLSAGLGHVALKWPKAAAPHLPSLLLPQSDLTHFSGFPKDTSQTS